ncbi:hypothetical protein DSM112329_04306 [Paraconexibacter sp. AEG42_29]|uniref:DSBA-like thioredoxin domain-containing protein n=1 Tax=Paraconexibacter sp. AEG42_29 TaxID=2997339 RepID=A0AAU7B0I5_9ACTN
MGDVIDMAGRRRQRGAVAERLDHRLPSTAATFFFDLASPETYLAAERVTRGFAEVRWVPVLGDAVGDGCRDDEELQQRAECRATELRMPLVWPEQMPVSFLSAMRVADYACDAGRGEPFVLAACRLAFCGGFDLDDPDILAEAAAAAGLPLDDCLRAAGDRGRDGALIERGRRLTAQGAQLLPAVRVRRTLFCGEDRLLEAAAAARVTGPARSLARPDSPTAG